MYVDECGSLKRPDYGKLNITGYKANYTCDPGYEMFGEAIRMCIDGSWEGNVPICSRKCKFINVLVLVRIGISTCSLS